jgi:hypothetical protein
MRGKGPAWPKLVAAGLGERDLACVPAWDPAISIAVKNDGSVVVVDKPASSPFSFLNVTP